jgi:transposase
VPESGSYVIVVDEFDSLGLRIAHHDQTDDRMVLAFVRACGAVARVVSSSRVSSERLIVFMRRPIKDARRKVFLVLDNLNVHKAKPVREWLEEQKDRIEVFYLPPYSPELNPSEYFNGDLKGKIQLGVPPKDVTELKRTVLGHSRRIQKAPDRVRAYFKHGNIRYAA